MWIGGVRVIVTDDESRVLMVRQHHENRDIWMIPGGGIEEGEDSRDAAAREVHEETGLEIEVGEMVWHVEEVSERGQRFVNYFRGYIKGGHMQLGKDPEFDQEHQVLREVKFMTREEIEAVENLYPEYVRKEFWELCIQGKLSHDGFKIRKK